MNELQRQQYLEQMGFTIWVSRSPLPGAMALPVLEQDELAPPQPDTSLLTGQNPQTEREPETGSPTVPQAQAAVSAAVETGAGEPKEVDVPLAVSPTELPEPVSDQPAAKPTHSTSPALSFAIESTLVQGVLLVTELPATDAPGLGRESLRLFQSLCQYFGGQPGQRKRFSWPLPGVPAEADQAGESVSHHLAQLANQTGCNRILLLLSESLTRSLFGVERYQLFLRQDRSLLPVSTLEEMLAEPVEHKRASWHAMVDAGFHRA